ncbi:N-acetylglutamate synthase, mitochondrial [Exaiptasia diaphana]|uniref:N-acetyltransferase domain-containing protein n=1 Tax=Exaiptasia diaphana TaxID=2652724 RepID=A0A913XRN3_EXADI|nr:N-acetylglutamate synthase, mitochondrial [Exaiptasia diaphana]KXJ09716.1 N-acetylglutamate synthase, mitochondrial [Exaiptasia diaphana]
MYTRRIRSTRFKNNGQCFKVLVNNAKRLVSQDAKSPSETPNRLHDNETEGTKIQTIKLFSHSRNSLFRNQASRDLKRFLEEVGTDPKEARYWLRHFQELEMKTEKPFAVVQIDSSVFNDEKMLERVASSLAFLYRNGMEAVVIHGVPGSSYGILDKKTKHQLIEENIKLVDLLEKNDVRARPFLCSSHMISVRTTANNLTDLGIDDADVKYINWCLSSGHIPVMAAIGETEDGQVVYTDATSTTVKIAGILKPTKVIFLNTTGALKDSKGKVIDCVSLPQDVDAVIQEQWMDESSLHMVKLITDLIPEMPPHTSAVITSADSLIKELFTHCGSGTLFQSAEPINVHHSLEGVDEEKLWELLVKSFNQSLDKDYFSSLGKNLHSLYITESYTAAAIIVTPEETCGIPYLDKFSISKQSQGLGTSNLLWEKITQDFPQLCWRSRGTNRINPWYFVRSTGSCQKGNWTVFWYGISDPHITHQITQYTCSLPSSFDPIAPHDEQRKKRISTSEYHKYL